MHAQMQIRISFRKPIIRFSWELGLKGTVAQSAFGTLPPCCFTISKRGQRGLTGGVSKPCESSLVLQKA
jgi:hypothetical protein